MAPVHTALQHILDHHEPLPAMVVDRFWNVRMKNRAADLLLAVDGDPEALLESVGSVGDINLALLTLHPNGLRKYISNWAQAAPSFILRLRNEAVASGDHAVQARFEEYIALAGEVADVSDVPVSQLPILPLELGIHGLSLSLFSVISTFGTPQDITTDELRIEAFYPTDDATRGFFESLG